MARLLALILLCLGVTAHGHEPMVHACTPPERPANDNNDQLWQAFMVDIEAFRNCVNDKMDWHQAAADAHNDNARQVVTLWNDFVQTSLNAPEDFPWPPQD